MEHILFGAIPLTLCINQYSFVSRKYISTVFPLCCSWTLTLSQLHIEWRIYTHHFSFSIWAFYRYRVWRHTYYVRNFFWGYWRKMSMWFLGRVWACAIRTMNTEGQHNSYIVKQYSRAKNTITDEEIVCVCRKVRVAMVGIRCMCTEWILFTNSRQRTHTQAPI